MNPGEVYYAVTGDRAYLKLVGVIRHPISQRLNSAMGRIFSQAEVRGVVVDLQQAEFIDSTCLGLLARVASRCLELGCERPVIVSVQPDINHLLCVMGFDRVFVLVADPAAPTTGLATASGLADIDKRPDPKLILEAHRALCQMNEQNQHLFQNVIEQLESAVLNEASHRAVRRGTHLF